ncbi:IclR family transcriptional regulator [Pseudooceanicola sp. MF1-13]|uniref:IclR family transcriptional regulator n=1 Tax=Pseudooceanicola sp. MF1-13 TaxID=3379095 RepID=UPI003892BB79
MVTCLESLLRIILYGASDDPVHKGSLGVQRQEVTNAMQENAERKGKGAQDESQPAKKKAPQGSQTVDKAMGLLKIIAASSADGLRLMDLAEQSGLDRATTYRLVTSLANHNFVDQDTLSKRYTLGLEFFALASAASNRHDLSDRARESLEHLADATGDTAMYCLRSGLDVICMDVQMGNFPVRTMPMDIGSRKPVGAGATGIAMLAPLPDPEVDEIIARSASRLARLPGSDPETIKREVQLCRDRGWALAADDTHGRIMGLSLCLTSRNGRPLGTLTLTGIPERFADDRVAGLAALLREEARALDEQLNRLPDTERHRTRWSGGRGQQT